MFGKDYDSLDTNQKKAVGGKHGGEARKEQLAEQAGGDVHAAYSKMGSQGGQASGRGN